MAKEFKFTIGADPEFNMEMNNKRLNAQSAISALLKDKKNFIPATQGFALKDKNVGNIGWDGHNSTGEIRPCPSNAPDGVVSNLMELFTEFYKYAPLFEISTLSRGAAIGGHIHFSIEIPEGQTKAGPRIKTLHKKIASMYLPILMGENKVNLLLRIKGGYGNLCNSDSFRVEEKFKKKDGTAGYTFELRAPSAEWMTTPKIAGATLAYLGVIYHEITNNPKNFDKVCKDIIITTDAQGKALQELALTEYKTLTTVVFNSIRKNIKQFELYEQFKEEIDYILNPTKVLADKQAVNYDVRQGWGLKTVQKEGTKAQIISTKEFKKEAADKDLDTASQFIKIGYNEDMNVETFAKTLAKRSVAFNWPLNKSYFLYGIRKGIKEYIIADENGNIIEGDNQIKTILDKEAVQALVKKMSEKAGIEKTSKKDSTKLNFITGKLEKIKNQTILIGIPYEKRIGEEIEEFMELIYDIDKETKKKTKVSKKEPEKVYENDKTKPDEEKGEIWKSLNGIEAKNREIAESTETGSENESHIESIEAEMAAGRIPRIPDSDDDEDEDELTFGGDDDEN